MLRMFRRHFCKKVVERLPLVLQEARFVIEKGEYRHVAELLEDIAQMADGRGGLLLLDSQ